MEIAMIKNVAGFDDYLIDDLGNVYSLKHKYLRQLKQQKDKDGYCVICLRDGYKTCSKKIHRLVVEAFIPNLGNKPQVNRINGNKQNNRVENLERCTKSENQIHAYKIGLHKKYKGKNNKNSRPIFQIKNNQVVNIFYNSIEASDSTGICRRSINKATNGQLKSAGGYQWKYKDC